MPAFQTLTIPPLDPYGFTGPVRMDGGIGRTGTVTYDTWFGEYARWIYIGTTGDLGYTKWDGTTETLPNMASGVWHPILAVQINTAGTTIAANQLRWGS